MSCASVANPTQFPLLADPAGYVPCDWNLTADPEQRRYWLGVFRSQFPRLLAQAVQVAPAQGASEAAARKCADIARDDFFAYLDAVTEKPDRFGRLDILQICRARERALRNAAIADPYVTAKDDENRSALQLLPEVIEDVDALSEAERWTAVVKGVFAGNIFDLGAAETAKLFQLGELGFFSTRKKLKPRPWLIDDLDKWAARLQAEGSYRAACVFVDNAGSDVVLGMIPFVRELLKRGTTVVLTANATPALNDITHQELTPLVHDIGRWDDLVGHALRDRRLLLISSGNGLPLIDLTHVSGVLAQAVERLDVDLVVLEGMGRAIESNFSARFACDCLKVAMVKDHGVARALGGSLYDLVFKFESP